MLYDGEPLKTCHILVFMFKQVPLASFIYLHLCLFNHWILTIGPSKLLLGTWIWSKLHYLIVDWSILVLPILFYCRSLNFKSTYFILEMRILFYCRLLYFTLGLSNSMRFTLCKRFHLISHEPQSSYKIPLVFILTH